MVPSGPYTGEALACEGVAIELSTTELPVGSNVVAAEKDVPFDLATKAS